MKQLLIGLLFPDAERDADFSNVSINYTKSVYIRPWQCEDQTTYFNGLWSVSYSSF